MLCRSPMNSQSRPFRSTWVWAAHVLVGVLSGCASPETRVGTPVWSEDRTMAAVLITRFRSGPRAFDTPTSAGHSYEIRVLELDGTLVWSSSVPDATGFRLMGSEGYILYSHLLENGVESVLQPLDGGDSRTIALHRTQALLPSPNGSLLALRSIEGAPIACDPCEVTIELLEARTLATESEVIRFPMPGPTSALRFMWIDAAHLVVWSGETAVAVRVDGTVLGAPVPTCDDLPTLTSSGTLDATGRYLTAELVRDEVVLTVHEGGELGWPARCWPHGGPEEWGG